MLIACVRWEGNVPGLAPYVIETRDRWVEVWAGYQIQFGGMRRFAWQDELVAELRAALALLLFAPGEALAGMYISSDGARCDVENRLFTNPGSATFPATTSAIRWERGIDLPAAPRPVADVDGGVHYYRYFASSTFQVWTPDVTLARWEGVSRPLAHDGSARPMWHALRAALIRGDVEVVDAPVAVGTRFGLRIEVRAPARGPRSAPSISEALVDGALSALHAGVADDIAPALGRALAAKITGADSAQLASFAQQRDAVFPGSPFNLSTAGVQLSPCDELCDAGEVAIHRDPSLTVVVTSGELFTLRPVMRPV
jgi:hypothetical protein